VAAPAQGGRGVTELRALGPAEMEAFETAAHSAFHEDAHPDDAAINMRLLEPERTLAVLEDGEVVATAAVLTRELSVPGAIVPAAAVTGVGVVPGHTRRGHLGALMRRQLDDIRAAGEAVAVLWASEGAIYGRYGYGPATRANLYELHLWRAGLREPSGERVRTLPAGEALDELRTVYEAVRPGQPGLLSRDDAWWAKRLHDPPHRRDGASALRAALVDGGYALYAASAGWDEGGPSGVVRVRELVANTPEARAALWTYLTRIDLMRTLHWRLAPDQEPLALMLVDADSLVMRTGLGLWVRLVELGAALTARTYAQPFELVIEVEDAFCPWNAGRHRLAFDGATATCEPTRAEPDLSLAADTLGAAYLGGTRFEALAAAGRVRELRPGALAVAASAFRAAAEPWCPEIF
jgi:predicted acetyltransferase